MHESKNYNVFSFQPKKLIVIISVLSSEVKYMFEPYFLYFLTELKKDIHVYSSVVEHCLFVCLVYLSMACCELFYSIMIYSLLHNSIENL